MTASREQIRDSFLYLWPTLIENALPLITLPIFTRILTPSDYGILALAQIYAIFVSGIGNFGMITTFDRNFFQFYKEPRRLSQFFYSTIFFVGGAGIMLGIITFIGKETFSLWIIRSPGQGRLLFWAFAAEYLLKLRQYYLVYYRNVRDTRAYSRISIMTSVLTVIFSLYAVAGLRLGVIGIIYGRLLANGLVWMFLHNKFLKNLPVGFSKGILTDSIKMSVPLTPRIFLGVVTAQFDKFMLGMLASVNGVGIYAIGQKISNVIFIFMTALQNVYQPQVYEHMFSHDEPAGRRIGELLIPFMYVSIFIALLISLFAAEILTLLTPPAYHSAVEVIMVLAMYFGILFFSKVNSAQILYRKKTFLISILSFLTLSGNVALNIPMILRFGAVGAAWATLTVGCFSVGAAWFLAQRYFRIHWDFFRIAVIFGLLFFGSLAVITLRNLQCEYFLQLLVKFAVAGIYIAFGNRWGIVNMQNFKTIKGLIFRHAV